MAHSVTGRLSRPANEFQAGESTGFGVRLGEKFYNRTTQQEEWTNYDAVIFSNNPAQIQYYREVLVEGSIIEVIADKQCVKPYTNNQNVVTYTIELLNARLGVAYAPQAGAAPQGAAPQQRAPQGAAPQQRAPQQRAPQGAAPQQRAPQGAAPQQRAPQAAPQGGYNQNQGGDYHQDQSGHHPQGGFQPQGGHQPQGGFQPQGNFNQGAHQQHRGPMEPPIDFDDDIPF